jgi:hypothetical protein
MEKTLVMHLLDQRKEIAAEIERVIAREEDKQKRQQDGEEVQGVESDDFIAGMEFALAYVR